MSGTQEIGVEIGTEIGAEIGGEIGADIGAEIGGEMRHTTFGRIKPIVPGFISKPNTNRRFPGTFVQILRKVAGTIFGKLGLLRHDVVI